MISKVENVNCKKSRKVLKIIHETKVEPYPLNFFKKKILKYNTEINIDRDLPIECRGVQQ